MSKGLADKPYVYHVYETYWWTASRTTYFSSYKGHFGSSISSEMPAERHFYKTWRRGMPTSRTYGRTCGRTSSSLPSSHSLSRIFPIPISTAFISRYCFLSHSLSLSHSLTFISESDHRFSCIYLNSQPLLPRGTFYCSSCAVPLIGRLDFS